MYRRILKFGSYGTAGVLGGTLALKLYTDPDSFVVVRCARAARAAVEIGYTYKTRLYADGLDSASPEYQKVKSECHSIGAQKLLSLCLANKGVYVKVGQHIGALDHLLPSEYVQTMKVLHKDAPPNSVEELFQVIREDLKKEPSEVFAEWEATPLGTASLAQVHSARLADGERVAVKVQHRAVRANVAVDLRAMEALVALMARAFPDFQMEWLVDETKRNIYRELNFLQEGKNAEKVAVMFKDCAWLKVPKIFWELSTERVLVMEYVDGGQVNDLEYITAHKINPYSLSGKLGELYARMIFVEGFVHSDPHPGNILVRQEPGDKDVTVYLLDHGLYANLTEKFRYHYSALWLAILARDRDNMRCHSTALGVRPDLYGLLACMVSGRPWETILKGIHSTAPSRQEKEQFQEALPQIANLITECLQTVDRQCLLVLKTNDLVRAVERALNTHARAAAHAAMARCCLLTVHRHRLDQASGVWERARLRAAHAWRLLSLTWLVLCLRLAALLRPAPRDAPLQMPA